jgi:hypothetical protein
VPATSAVTIASVAAPPFGLRVQRRRCAGAIPIAEGQSRLALCLIGGRPREFRDQRNTCAGVSGPWVTTALDRPGRALAVGRAKRRGPDWFGLARKSKAVGCGITGAGRSWTACTISVLSIPRRYTDVHPEVGMPEFPLYDDERHALARHLDSVSMPELIGRNRRRTPAAIAALRSWTRTPAAEHGRPRVGPRSTQNNAPAAPHAR